MYLYYITLEKHGRFLDQVRRTLIPSIAQIHYVQLTLFFDLISFKYVRENKHCSHYLLYPSTGRGYFCCVIEFSNETNKKDPPQGGSFFT